jgi:CysZ protein
MPPSATRGASYALRGIRYAFRPRIRRYVLVPLLINLALFSAGIFVVTELLNKLLDRLPDWLDWLRFVLWPLFAVGAAAVVFFSFAAVANFIGAPFNGRLSRAVERELGAGSDGRGGFLVLISEGVTAIGGEVRKFLYFLIRAIPLLLLFLIPPINVIAPVLWLVFGAWMSAIEYAECPMGNHGLSLDDVRAQLRARYRTALGFGAAVMALTMIPGINFIAMPAAVCGATLMWVEEFAAD